MTRSRMGYISIQLASLESWTNGRIFRDTNLGFVAESYGTTPISFRGSPGRSQATRNVARGTHGEYLRRARRRI